MKRETEDLMTMLETAGFTLTRAEFEDGGCDHPDEFTTNREDMLEHLMACGHGVLHVAQGDNEDWIYLIGGQGASDLVANYSCRATTGSNLMDKVIMKHSDKWLGTDGLEQVIDALEVELYKVKEALDAIEELAAAREIGELESTAAMDLISDEFRILYPHKGEH